MSNIFEFNGLRPVIKESAFIHPLAQVIGDVIIGEKVYVGAGAVLRGDWGRIKIAAGSNIQENCVVHMFPGKTVEFEENSHIGHGAVVHGSKVGRDVLVGMNSVLMDDVVIGKESIVGALTFVSVGTIIPQRSVVVGNPAKVIKQVSDKMLDWKKKGTELYQQLPKQCYDTLRPCEPLRTIGKNGRKVQNINYPVWKS